MLMLIGPEMALLPPATCYLREITGLSLPSVMYHAITHASVKPSMPPVAAFARETDRVMKRQTAARTV